MARPSLPVLLLFGVAILAAAGMLAVSALTVRARPTPVKDSPYESGIPPLGDARERFSVKFYMVAMLFIIFDIETVFMIPWGVFFRGVERPDPETLQVMLAQSERLGRLVDQLLFMVILLV